MIKKILSAFLTFSVAFSAFVYPAMADVIVKPNEAGVSTDQTFIVGVTNEKDTAIVAVRLRIPEELTAVIPNAKPGWTISVNESEDTDGNPMTEIEWNEGEVPVGQRDEFRFEAKLPERETTLAWKAYQTYEDGTIVSWDQIPTANISQEDQRAKNLGPYSETKVIAAVKEQKEGNPITSVTQNKDDRSFFLSMAALIISGIAIGMQMRRKK